MVPLACVSTPPVASSDPPIERVPLAASTVPEFTLSEPASAKLLSSMVKSPEPMYVTEPKSEPFA